MSRALDECTASAFLILIGGYLILSYAFMQLRIPPVGFGVPLGELLLVAILLRTDLPRVLSRLNTTVFLVPFLIWWGWGSARMIFDTADRGFWALRDSTQLIESLFLIAGFTLAAEPRMVARLARWLRPIIFISCLYGLSFVYADAIADASPKLPGASDQPVPIFGAFATTGTMLLLGAFYCMTLMTAPHRPAIRMRDGLVAGFLIAFALLVLQMRTTYLQLLGLVGLLLIVRPRALGRLGLAIPVFLFLLVVIAAFDLRISGRLTSQISLSFFWDHIQAIFGISATGQGGVAEAASGVPLRLGWWYRLYNQLTADPVTLITGLGYGIPLTDFRDSLGVVTREPHNSLISVTARLGLIGAVSWIWMQVELLRTGFHAYRNCRRNGWDEAARLLLLILAFAVLTLASCFGEDTMEKPYYAIPYYGFWGFALRIAYRLRVDAARDHAAYSRPPLAGMLPPNTALLMLVLVAGVTAFSMPSNARAAPDDTATIENAMKQAAAGTTVIIPPGNHRVSRLVVRPNITLHAPHGAVIIGDIVARGPNTVIRGFTFAGGTIDISHSQSVSIGDCVFNGGMTAIRLDSASNALVINNEFHGVRGGVITGWGLDQSTISGNRFFDCGQCVDLHFINDPGRGRNIVIERNTFTGVARMPVEVGPLEAYTANMIVRDNWATDFKNRGPDPGATMSTFVAYSIVPTHGVNTIITGNYAIAGPRGRGAIGIELDGSGEITGNYMQDFKYGAIVYGAGHNVHDNAFLNTTEAKVLNYAKRPGRIADDGSAKQMPRTPRMPERRGWPPQN